jgi:superfamily II DNA or RNA helicase
VRLREQDATIERVLLLPFDRPRKPPRPSVSVMRPRRFRRHLDEVAASMARPGGLRTPAASGIRLLPYQLAPLVAIERYGATRVLIADEVGLGKTIQAGLVLAELASKITDGRFLIVVPAGLRDQWRRELRGWFSIDATVCDTGWLARAAADVPPGVNPWAAPGALIVSMDLLKRPEVLTALEGLSWDLLILDEAHLVTMESERRRGVEGVARRSGRVLLLTATPHPGEPRERDALCAVGRIARGDPPIVCFRRTREVLDRHVPRRSAVHRVRLHSRGSRLLRLITAYARGLWGHADREHDHRLRLLAMVLQKRGLSGPASLQVSLRRRLEALREDAAPVPVQPALPLYGEDEDRTDEVADALLAMPGPGGAIRERRWLTTLDAAARHAAPHDGKERWLLRFLRRAREPVLVFTEYRDTLVRLAKVAARAGHRHLLLHGGLDRDERAHVEASFAAGGWTLLATDAASTGLNLQAACRVIVHYELPWTLSRLVQRAGRVDRIGQTRRVHEILLVQDSEAEGVVLEPLLARAARARSEGLGTGAAQALTESQAGALFFAPGSARASAPPPPAPWVTLDLDAEADEEARFAEWIRQVGGGRSRSPPDCIAATVLPSARRATGLMADLVFRLSARNEDGGEVESELCFGSCPVLGGAGASRRPVDLRRSVLALQRELSNGGRHPLAVALAPRLEALVSRARAHHARATSEPDARQRAIAQAAASRPGSVVQAGLFDNRATRAALERARHEAVERAAEVQRQERATRAAQLHGELRLAAVVVRGERQGAG